MATEKATANKCCANCGITAVDGIKLRSCSACHLVRYCSVKCQKEHRPKHKRECKKRVAELREELLFKQPTSTHLGDCPICLLPLPIRKSQYVLQSCCMKTLCNGCTNANLERELKGKFKHVCPFCRKPIPRTVEEATNNCMKRAEANDPVALKELGLRCGMQGDHESSIKYMKRSADLGDAEAYFFLANAYLHGIGVEEDPKLMRYFVEEAAIAGHPDARHILGHLEGNDGRFDVGVKHFIIGANQGCEKAIKALKDYYKYGDISKEDLESALRAQQAAVDAMKSPQREAAVGKEALYREIHDFSKSKRAAKGQNHSQIPL